MEEVRRSQLGRVARRLVQRIDEEAIRIARRARADADSFIARVGEGSRTDLRASAGMAIFINRQTALHGFEEADQVCGSVEELLQELSRERDLLVEQGVFSA